MDRHFEQLLVGKALFQRRLVWWPTALGWFCILLVPGLLLGTWILFGESFLSQTRRVPAETLIVEGWIGREALPFSKHEFERGGYKRLIVTGGLTGYTWARERWSVTEIAQRDLLRLGFPEDKLLLAPCDDVENQRTYFSAVAARRAIERQGWKVESINVISRGPHARRTHSVYSKVFGSDVAVGVISWNPYASHGRAWWRSSVRAKELLDETFGWTYEALFNSGRGQLSWRSWAAISIFVLVAFILWRKARAAMRRSQSAHAN
jgi:hypothetical protein